MAITLDKTVGGANSNAYADVADADARAAVRLVSPLAVAWLASNDTERKKSALISATMDIDSVPSDEIDFISEPASSTQALQFPRLNSPNALPQNLVAATIELAFTLLPTAASEPFEADVNDKKSVQAGDVKVEFFAPESEGATSVERWPQLVQRLMAPLLQKLVTAGLWGTGTVQRTS